MKVTNYLIILLSYLIGCMNTGYYYTRLIYKKDVRSVGTMVTGATNVSRVAGKKGFIITFLGDSIKGALVVLICRYNQLGITLTLVCMLMVIVGHIFPLQLKLRGGKGISTMFGAFFVYDPYLILLLLLTCVMLFPMIKRYTVTSLFAMVLLPIELFFLGREGKEIALLFLCMLVIIYACRSNLQEYFQRNKT